jgi:hypothetical protein
MATNICFTDLRQMAGVALEDISAPNENITSSGSSQQATITAGSSQVVLVVETDTSVWVTVGANPTAAAGTDRLVQGGTTRYFWNVKEGDKVAVINA